MSIKDKGTDILEQQLPKIKTLVEEKIGPATRETIENDEFMTKAFSRIYDLMRIAHPIVMKFVKRERFIAFCLKNRDRLMEQYDSRKAITTPSQPGKGENALPPSTSDEKVEAKMLDYRKETNMSEEKTRAEQLFGQGMSAFLFGEDIASYQKAASLLSDALKEGLPRKKEIFCHLELGIISLEIGRQLGERDRASKENINDLPNLNRGVSEFEKALSLDAQTGDRNLGDRLSQARLLQPLDCLWTSQSNYIKQAQGADAGLAYLQDKLKKIAYLGPISLPGLCMTSYFHYDEAKNKSLASDWLKRAAEAETYEDIEETRTLSYFKVSQHYKNTAKQILQSSPSSSKSSNQVAKKSGCLSSIAVIAIFALLLILMSALLR